MADLRLRINELSEELTPAPIDYIAIDGPSTRKTSLQNAANAVRPYSSEAQAREGLNAVTTMTPQRVSQAIETLGGQRFATSQQGNKADSAVQPTLTISVGTGLTGGGTLAANREIALSSASLASLALANSAVQPARQVIAGTGLTGGGTLAADRTVALSAGSIASLAKADTAIQALGGATGQVLAKNSATDNDVSWQTVEAATAVSYGPQSLTASQRDQARSNIGAQAALGFTPVNNAGGTMTGRLGAPGITVPGSSGITPSITMQPNGTGDTRRAELYIEIATTTNFVMRVSNPALAQDGFFVLRSNGSMSVPGAFTAGSKSFQIDHVKDPYNKYLVFMSTEAPKAGVEDWGRIRLINGEVEVDLDIAGNLSHGTFAALTQRAIVVSVNNLDGDTPVRAGRIVDGKFKIYAINNPNCDDEVTWLMKAERADRFIKSHMFCDPETGLPIPEQEKED